MKKALFLILLLLAFVANGCAEDNQAAYRAGESMGEVLDITSQPTPDLNEALAAYNTPAYITMDMAPAQGYTLRGGVNLRGGPDTSFAVLTVLDKHDPLTITGKCGDWYRVEHASGKGYLSGEFAELGDAPMPMPTPTPKPYTIEKLTSKKAYVYASEVNFRAGPDTSYPIRHTASRFDKVTITGQSGDWYRLRYKSETGYMLKRYIKVGISPADYEGAGGYSNEDVLLLSQIAYRESAKGSIEGYKAVASVVINRVKSKSYPNTVERVVFQGSGAQFSPARNAQRLRLTIPTRECVNAVREVLKNSPILPANILYFRSASKGKDWAKARKYYDTLGGNCFYS